ncbi:MAG: glycosyltransferase [Anaerolineales bacterium]|nr:glycosyltransferase [Anaerolineales bacterium]
MVSGAAIVASRLAEGLARRGHTVLVLAASERGPAYTVEQDGLRVTRLASWHNPWRVGQRFVAWPAGRVAAALRAFHPQVVHSHDPTGVGLAALLAARALRVPTALTLHQLPWFVPASLPAWAAGPARPLEAAVWAYYRWLSRRVGRLITPSAVIAQIVRAQGAGAPLSISNSVDVERFHPDPPAPEEAARLRQRYGLDPDRPILLHVGRLDADKRVDLVLRAAAHALRSVDAQVLIVGDGRRRKALEALAAQLHVPARFTGYVAGDGDLPGLYRLAAVFVTASEVEIQSSVVLEAGASGRPVVAVRASSMAEFIEDGRNGYLTPAGDAAALGARAAELIRDPARAAALGRAGRELAQGHAPAATLTAHEAVYAELSGAPPSSFPALPV